MKLEIRESANEVARRAAEVLSDAVQADPALVAALPTGRTPVSMYEILAAMRQTDGIDFGRVSVFNLDEVLLPKALPETFFQFMTRHVWEPLGVAPERRFIPDGEATDPEAECLRYEAAIAAAGGLDLVILGIGVDGHIAYNLPGQAGPRTHVVTLDPVTAASLGGETRGPVRAITMGIQTILSAKKILLLATGASKAEPLRRMRNEAMSDAWPCTFLREHGDLTVIADEAAAGS